MRINQNLLSAVNKAVHAKNDFEVALHNTQNAVAGHGAQAAQVAHNSEQQPGVQTYDPNYPDVTGYEAGNKAREIEQLLKNGNVEEVIRILNTSTTESRKQIEAVLKQDGKYDECIKQIAEYQAARIEKFLEGGDVDGVAELLNEASPDVLNAIIYKLTNDNKLDQLTSALGATGYNNRWNDLYGTLVDKLSAYNLANFSESFDRAYDFYNQKAAFAETIAERASLEKKIEYDKIMSDRKSVTPAISEVDKAQQAYDDADKKAKEKDRELAEELAVLGGTLTEAQLKEYVAAFRNDPANVNVYRDRAMKAEALADVLKNNKVGLYATSNPADVAKLKKALSAIACDPSTYKIAIEFLSGAPKELTDALGGKAFLNQIADSVLPLAMAECLAKSGSTEEAFREFTDFTGSIKPMFDAYGGCQQLNEGIEELRNALGNGSHLNVGRLQQLVEDWSTQGLGMKGLAVAGVMIGLLQAGREGLDGNYLTMVKELTQAGRPTLEIVAGALGGLNAVARYELAKGAVKWASRLAPGIGALGAGFSAGLRIEELKKHPDDFGQIVGLFGDAIGVLGGVIEVIPGATEVGLPISGIGALLSAGGDFISSELRKDDLIREREKYLSQISDPNPSHPKARLSHEVLHALATGQLEPLAEQLGMSPEQIQRAAKTSAYLRDGDSNIAFLAYALAREGITGKKAAAFFAGGDAAIAGFLHRVESSGLTEREIYEMQPW